MWCHRSSAVCFCLFAAFSLSAPFAVTPALSALSMTYDSATDGRAVVPVAGRKGTRNYEPEHMSEPLLREPPPSSNAVSNDELEHCISTWDKDTHMTKEAWRETCKRVLRERASEPDI
jgi:hypothetical protein